MRYTIVLLLVVLSCSSKEEQVFTEIEIRTNSPETLIEWYTSNLSLTRSAQPNEFKVSGPDFGITFSKTDVPKPEGRTTGFFKYGFTTNQIDDLYSQLKQNGVNFRGELFFDENLNQRSFLTLDSDGNRIQFFEDNSQPHLTPYFFSIITSDFQNAHLWYQEKMGFDEGFDLSLPDREIKIRLMKTDRWLLELLALPGTNPPQKSSPGLSSFAGIPLR